MAKMKVEEVAKAASSPSDGLIEIVATKDFNSSAFGKFHEGKKAKVSIAFAAQMEAQDFVKCLPDESNQDEYEKELTKALK